MADDTAPPDWLAVERLRHGDLSALDVLYVRHAATLLRIAWHVTGSRADAEDVVHDVFVALPNALQRYEERGTLDAWLRTIVVRRAADRARRDQRRRELPLDAALHARAPDAPAPDDADAARLATAIAALPPVLRATFVLRTMEGLPFADVAAALGIRVGTAHVRYFRAVRLLRRHLEDTAC